MGIQHSVSFIVLFHSFFFLNLKCRCERAFSQFLYVRGFTYTTLPYSTSKISVKCKNKIKSKFVFLNLKKWVFISPLSEWVKSLLILSMCTNLDYWSSKFPKLKEKKHKKWIQIDVCGCFECKWNVFRWMRGTKRRAGIESLFLNIYGWYYNHQFTFYNMS